MSSQARQSLSATAPAIAEPTLDSPRPNAQSRYGNSFLAEQLANREVDSDDHAGAGHDHSHEHGPDAPPSPDMQFGSAQSTATPLRVKHPLPRQTGDQSRTCLGVQILGSNVSPSALDACEAFVKLTLSARKDIQERMKNSNVALVIIPSDKKMTDVSQFASLKGTKTVDGRIWDDVRGSGGMATGGLWAIAVPEENLIEQTPSTDKYAEGYSVGLHELAHTIQNKGVSSAERKTITALYEARKKAGGPWTDTYASSNELEYFAQATNCYHGANRGQGKNGPKWLKDNDNAMFEFLKTLYGEVQVAENQFDDALLPSGDSAYA